MHRQKLIGDRVNFKLFMFAKRFGIIVLLVISMLLVNVLSAAPYAEWNKTFGEGIAMFVQQTSDGGYVLAAREFASNSVLLIKTDVNGNQQWYKTVGNSPTRPVHARQTSDGGYILTTSTVLPESMVGEDVSLIKTDLDGNLQWNRSFNIFPGSYRCIPQSVQQSSDGGYILVGAVHYSDEPSDAFVIKTDANGNVQWNKTFGRPGSDGAYSVQQASDGSYVFVGYSQNSIGKIMVWLVKIDADGNTQFDKTFGEAIGGSYDDPYSNFVHQTSDGGYILIAGYIILKTDANGNLQWSKPGVKTIIAGTTSDGGYIGVSDDGQLIKLDANGTFLLGKQVIGEGMSVNSVKQTSDGGYILAGAILNYTTQNILLIKTFEPKQTITPTSTPATTNTATVTSIPIATATLTPNVTLTATFTPSPTSISTSTPVPTVTATQTRTPCPQVPTWAVNPEGKNCREFSSPCDVPRNWIVVDSCQTSAPTPKQCHGCLYADSSCIPFGTRLGPQYSVVPFNGTASYCDVAKKTIEPQKGDGMECQNNYECASNYCSNGVCGNIQKELQGVRDLLNKIIEFLKGLFLSFGKGQ